MYNMGCLALCKAVQFSRKCSTVSSSGLHSKHVGSIWFWLNAALLHWRMYVPVTSFNFVVIRGISRALPIIRSTECLAPYR